MKFTYLNHDIVPSRMKELYEIDSSYLPLVEFARKWIMGEHSFEVFSSGSTGPVKKITLYRKQIEASVAATSEFLGLQSGEKIMMCLNPSYIGGLMMAARGLILDMDVHIVQPKGNPLDEIGNEKIDFASFVPYQIHQIIEGGQLDRLSQIRNVLIGGAPLNDETFSKLSTLPNNLYMTYGMTETASHIALMPIKGEPKDTAFHLLPNLFIGTNEKGCLWVEGNVTNNQRLQTTDVVEIRDEVYFKWMGRNDFVINSGGVKIHPEQVEKIIAREFERIGIKNEFYISGVSDSQLGEMAVLKIEGSLSDEARVFENITPAIEQELSKYHVPKGIRIIEEFERTESGKVKRL